MSDDNNPLALSPQAERAKELVGKLPAERRTIEEAANVADRARVRRLEVWLELDDIRAAYPEVLRSLGYTQEYIAEVSGVTPTTLSQTLRRHREGD